MATTKKSRKTAKKASGGADLATVGRYVFLGGIVLSLLAGLFFAFPSFTVQRFQMPIVYLLIVLALVGGYLHVSKEGEKSFMLTAFAVYFFSDRLSYVPSIGNYLTSILGVLGVFLSLAALAVAARSIVSWFRS
ncbi:MAG: hypothetical protein KF698_05180 [Anaerolineales bacterium]|nr:hypothetical protein [Anaerolineales bacterium]